MPLRVRGSGEAVWAFLHSSVRWDVTIKNRRISPNSKTRFRWIQESSAQKNVPPFGLDGVYISEPCPNYCSGHGDCISGVCFCDLGYTGKANTCLWQYTDNRFWVYYFLCLRILELDHPSTWAAEYSVVSSQLERKPAKFHSLKRMCLSLVVIIVSIAWSPTPCRTL